MTSASQAKEMEAVPPQFPESELGIVKLLARRWWLLPVGALMGVTAALLYSNLVPKRYESTAKLVVVKKHPGMVAGFAGSGGGFEDYGATQVGIIQSPVVVENAIQIENLASLETFNGSADPVGDLIRGLSVKRDSKERTSSIVELSFKGREPEECPKILAAVIAQYQRFLRQNYEAVSGKPLKLVKDTKDAFERDLARKEAAYAAFRQKYPAVQSKGRNSANSPNEMLLTLQSKRVALRVRRAEIESLLAKIEKGWAEDSSHEELMALISQLPGRANAEDGKAPSSFVEEKLVQSLIEDRTLSAEFAPTHQLVVASRKRVEMTHKVVTAILKQQLEATRKAEASLDQLYQEKDGEAKLLASAEVEDEGLREEIAHIKNLSDSTAKQLIDVQIVQDLGGGEAEVIAPPTSARLDSQSNPRLIVPAGGLLGLLAGAALTLLAPTGRHKTWPNSERIRQHLGWQVVGRIPAIWPVAKGQTSGPAAILCMCHRPSSLEAEAYRGVRTTLLAAAREEHKVIQVTAIKTGQGASTFTANLAVSLAQAGRATLLIDADLRRPMVNKLFGLSPRSESPSLASLLSDGGNAADAIQASGIPGLSVLSCGHAVANSAELLSSPRMKALCASLREQYAFVLLDTPPVLAVSDSTVVASCVDGVLLVMRHDKKWADQSSRVKEMLAAVDPNVLGVVVTQLHRRHAARQGGYEGYATSR